MNQGRIKSADNAQAICALIKQLWGKSPLFNSEQEMYQVNFEFVANACLKAGLIEGSIFDEYGRIENKDAAHEICDNHNEVKNGCD